MRMLRLALVLTLALVWAPEIHAQVFPGVIAPGGTLVYSAASETCVNTTSECQVFQYTIPAAYLATAPAINALVSQYLDGRTSTGVNIPVIWNTPQPMHLSMLGHVSAGASVAFNVGVNLGGTAASTGVSNNIPPTSPYNQQPIQLDVYIVPLATTTATPTSTNNNLLLTAVLTLRTSQGGVATVNAANTIVSMNLASPAQLNVLNRWGAANTANSIVWLKRVLKVGD